MRDLKEVLDIPSDKERHRLLIERGWQLQRAEAKTDKEREFCDWMIDIATARGAS